MKFIERKSCPLCHRENISLFRQGTFDPGSLQVDDFKITDSHYGSLWTFYQCHTCRFVFFNPYIPPDQVVSFYSRLEDREYSTEAEGRAKNFKTILKRLHRFNPGSTLLDIGAASGIFLNLARQDGFEVQGIEPSSFLVAEAKNQYGLDLFKGTLEEFPVDRKFAVITLLDIIEHLVEPDEFMGRVDELLEKNGLLVLVTPDIGSLAARMTGKRWWHFRIAHINFFNRKAMTYFLEKHHYKIVLKKKYTWHFSLFYLVTRIFPGLKHRKSLQKVLKRLHLKLPLFDSWEIYARRNE